MSTATLYEINIKGIEALKKALEPLELIRFFQQYELGHGNYTEERREQYKEHSIEELCSQIQNRKNKNGVDKT